MFRALAIAASPPGEREKFLDQIADQVESIAVDVTSIESTLMFADLDELTSIKESVDTIEKNQSSIERALDDLRDEIRRLSDKIEE